MSAEVAPPVCPWCEHQIGRMTPAAFIAATTDEHGRAMTQGACRRHVAALLAWFAGESRTGAVNVRRVPA